MPDKLHIDIETYSSVDIKTAGHYKYIESPDFEILILCYALNDGEVVEIDMTALKTGSWESKFANKYDVPYDFLQLYTNPSVQKWAHNATFERNAFKRIGLERPIEEWYCSAIQSAYCGYPLSLEAVSKAMDLGEKGKSSTGKALIKYFSIPCAPTKVNGGRTRNLPEHDPEKWQQFIEYCAMDVEAEREITDRLKKYTYPEFERQMYILDQEINDRGIQIDVDMAKAAVKIVKQNAEVLGGQIKEITKVKNPNSDAQLKEWLGAAMKKEIKSLAKDVIPKLKDEAGQLSDIPVIGYPYRPDWFPSDYKTLEEDDKEALLLRNGYKYAENGGILPKSSSAKNGKSVKAIWSKLSKEIKLNGIHPEDVVRVFELRQRSTKTSNKKYGSMLNSVGKDGRGRGFFQHYGANRTGRWAGRIVQLQNLPRNYIKDLDLAREVYKEGDYEIISMFFDNVPDVLSQLIRTTFVAKEGHTFAVADFSAIEARVIAWLAGEKWRLDVFNSHGKIYEASAAMMFNIPIEQVTKGSEWRQKGKIAELALGYQGSVGAMKTMGAAEEGLSEEEMKDIVNKWRAKSPQIVKLWKAVEYAAKEAFSTGKTIVLPKYRNLKFQYDGHFLMIELPSGRRLHYVKPRFSENRFGQQSLKYQGMDQNTKKWGWVESYGGKFVENIVQAIARDLLAVAMLRLDDHGFDDIVMHVHDEAVAEVPLKNARRDLEYMEEIMGRPVEWAKGLPLGADGYLTPYYRKD